MGLRITGSGTVENNIAKAQREASKSLERLSSGVKFTKEDPLPAERALSDSLGMKMRESASYKRNANDGMSVVQTADSALNEISNIVVRLKELATQASSSTLSDRERQFLFIEYNALYDEVDRISKTTSFNGMDLLNGNSSNGGDEKGLAITVGPNRGEEDSSNVIRMSNLQRIAATSENLGLVNVRGMLRDDEGVSLDDVIDVFSSDSDTVSGSFDTALEKIASFRSEFGAISSRLTHVLDVLDISQ
jgi:flagellin